MVKKVKKRRFRRHTITALGIIIIISIALTLPWRWIAPPTTAYIIQDRFQHSDPIQRRWVSLDDISPNLRIAVVAAEDQKFPNHHGFDFQSLSRSLREDRRNLRGASTISQQLAKNLFLWPGRSLIRKGLEAYFTVLIETMWPKRRILEVYLNVVEFGPNVYGADAASRLFFNKPPGRINSREAALLAAVLPNPKRMSALRPSKYVLKRASKIERAVRALGGSGYMARL